jgi:hypothetical protein
MPRCSSQFRANSCTNTGQINNSNPIIEYN